MPTIAGDTEIHVAVAAALSPADASDLYAALAAESSEPAAAIQAFVVGVSHRVAEAVLAPLAVGNVDPAEFVDINVTSSVINDVISEPEAA